MGHPIPLNIKQSYGIRLITGLTANVILALHVWGFLSVPAGPKSLNSCLTVGAFRRCEKIWFHIASSKSVSSLIPMKNTRSLFCGVPYSAALITNGTHPYPNSLARLIYSSRTPFHLLMVANDLTFSITNALGLTISTTFRKDHINWLRSSLGSIFPITENPWHGGPPNTKSMSV